MTEPQKDGPVAPQDPDERDDRPEIPLGGELPTGKPEELADEKPPSIGRPGGDVTGD